MKREAWCKELFNQQANRLFEPYIALAYGQ